MIVSLTYAAALALPVAGPDWDHAWGRAASGGTVSLACDIHSEGGRNTKIWLETPPAPGGRVLVAAVAFYPPPDDGGRFILDLTAALRSLPRPPGAARVVATNGGFNATATVVRVTVEP